VLAASGGTTAVNFSVTAGSDQTTGDSVSVTNFESIDASLISSALTLTGSSSANTITGGSGNDTIDGGGGADIIAAGGGNDTVTYTDSQGQTVTRSNSNAVTLVNGTKDAKISSGLNPSAAYGPAKCWPVEKFAAVVQEVSRRLKAAVWLIFGTPNDRELCERIAQLPGTRAANLTGKTSLRELMTLLKLCRLVLTNDSGPMHVAAALGTPVVVPFGSTSPELTGPGSPGETRHAVLSAHVSCSPCFLRVCPIDMRCMTGISETQIVEAVIVAAGKHLDK